MKLAIDIALMKCLHWRYFVLPENLTEDFMAPQYYSHVIILKYTVVDSIQILHDTPQFV